MIYAGETEAVSNSKCHLLKLERKKEHPIFNLSKLSNTAFLGRPKKIFIACYNIIIKGIGMLLGIITIFLQNASDTWGSIQT